VGGLQTGALLGGAVITETIFAWPGVGRRTLASFVDIGYVAVPEPMGATLLLIGIVGIVLRSRRAAT